MPLSITTLRFRDLRHTVEIQNLAGSTAADSRGQTQKVFVTAETVQAAIMPLSGRELAIAREIAPRATHKVETYYTSTITPESRLKYSDRYLNVESVLNVGERDRWMQILCQEEL